MKNLCFSTLHQNLDCRILQKRTFNFNFSPHSNLYFSRITGFIFSSRIGIEDFIVVNIFQMGHLSICVPCIRILTVRKLRKVLILFKFSLVFEFCILQSEQELNLKHDPCRWILRWKTVDFVPCIWIMKVPNFQKKYL